MGDKSFAPFQTKADVICPPCKTVRRDNCRLVSSVIETCLHKMLIDRDVQGAEQYTKQVISDLLQNKIDMSQLVITKALAKSGSFFL